MPPACLQIIEAILSFVVSPTKDVAGKSSGRATESSSDRGISSSDSGKQGSTRSTDGASA
ncbi:hypothetical protein GeomeDRAFT_0034 [Geobacter metallireducens RCH3]|uniref:hypothetical protein n=1 Tax=Geobacter metallireducens TaxID=28232 RepID=UPI00024A416B|nr:hypothetical protein [Geobacter metallireducens]EHP89236.1 hypothetical protein GeomeDRAFT_0034 [Geobacter metallireducens RCH3]